MNQYIFFSILVIPSSFCIASDKPIELAQAEQSCSLESYRAALSNPNLNQNDKSRSLVTILRNCSASGNIKRMVQASLDHGARAESVDEFRAMQNEGLNGYEETALGHFARINLPENLSPSAQTDLNETVQIISEQNKRFPLRQPVCVTTALIDAAYHSNIPAAKALLHSGANPRGQASFRGLNMGPTIASYEYERRGLYMAYGPLSAILVAQFTLRDHKKCRRDSGWSALKTTFAFPFQFGLLKTKIVLADSSNTKKRLEEEIAATTKNCRQGWEKFKLHHAHVTQAKRLLKLLELYKPAA